MPESLKALRRRVRSVKNTRQITRAMEMVSASKLKRAETALHAALPYNARLSDMLRRLVLGGNTPDNPLFTPREEVKTRLVVVFAADRGLCGAYNAQVFKGAEAYLRQCVAEEVSVTVMPVGRRSVEYFTKKRRDLKQAGAIAAHGGKVSVELARQIADLAIEEFSSGRVDEVHFLYNKFISTSKSLFVIEKFLPFDREAFGAHDADAGQGTALEYIYEPSAERVFESLLPRFIQSKVYVALAAALTAEHSARMLAMNSATKNCKDLIESLTLRMNKARQASITKEILEIVSGAEALNG